MVTVHFGSDLSTNCTMKQDGETLTKNGHWAWDNTAKTITVLSSYLTTLDTNKTYTFVATGNSGKDGDEVTFTIFCPAAATISPTTGSGTAGAMEAVAVSVTFGNTGEGLSKVKVGNEDLATANYTFAEGTLTLKADYLNTLTADEYVYTIVGDKGGEGTLTVTVSAAEE